MNLEPTEALVFDIGKFGPFRQVDLGLAHYSGSLWLMFWKRKTPLQKAGQCALTLLGVLALIYFAIH